MGFSSWNILMLCFQSQHSFLVELWLWMCCLCLISHKKSPFTWLGCGALPQSSSGDVPLLGCANKMLHQLLWDLGKSFGKAKGDWHKLLHQLKHREQRLLHPPFVLQSSSLGPGSFHVSPLPAAGHPDDPDKDMFFICWISQLRSSRGQWPKQGDVLKTAEFGLCQYYSGISGSAWSILLPKFSFRKCWWSWNGEQCCREESGSVTGSLGGLRKHHTPPCSPCLWAALLPTHLSPALGKIIIKSLLCFKCCHKNACGILLGGQSEIEVHLLNREMNFAGADQFSPHQFLICQIRLKIINL